MFIDTHAHLDFKNFNEDRDEVIARAHEMGVTTIITIGTDVATSKQNVEIAQAAKQTQAAQNAPQKTAVFAAVGIHPSDSDRATDENITKLRILVEHDRSSTKSVSGQATQPQADTAQADTAQADTAQADTAQAASQRDVIVAIGECGLDFFKNYHPHDIQIAAFIKQIQLAKELDLPLIVHSRGAETECVDLLIEHDYTRAVLHCFGGGLGQAQRAWQAGIMTSFTANITYPKNEETREIVKQCPEDMFMIETDAPFLAPQSKRGDRNQPAYVIETAEKIAEVRSTPLEDVATTTTKNAQTFFKLGST
jgi:TatD DNase family protein